MITFKDWLIQERGTKFTATGLNSGGMAQHASRFRHIKPHSPNIKTKIKPFLHST